ncbi:response regulator transcription factor, partial [Spirillospora sp. NPDC046719]
VAGGRAPRGGLAPAVNQVEALYRLGRWDDAAELLARRLDRHHGPAVRLQMMIWRIALLAARGTGPEPDPEALAVPLGAGPPQTVLPLAQMIIEWRLAEEDRPAARATAEAVLRHPRLAVQPCYLWPLLEAIARAGGTDPSAIAALAARTPAATPVAAAHKAAVTALTGGPAGWDAVIRTWERLDLPYPLAQALFDAACADLARGDRASAAERLDRAAGIAARLGAAPLARRISERARRAGLSGPAGGPLTARESEVVRLLARGRSNREIAEELVISPKTASVHVSNILAKLGVASRGEAAAAARDRGLA